jgi:hypothetical protein
MNIRKIAVVGSFAAGAALALAPLASADPDPAAVDPLAPFVASEVASMNSLFQTDAFLTGVPATDYAVGPQGFDAILPGDVATVQDNGTTPFDFLLYGVNPTAAGLASDPGAFTEFNGALVNFDDAYNTELFSLLNPTAPIDTIPLTDLFGSASGITEALATGSASGAVTDFLTDGWNDLLGYFGVFTG